MLRRLRPVIAAAAAAFLLTESAFAALPVVRLTAYASGFVAPVAFVQDPADPQVQFVVEQGGRIFAMVSGVVQPAPFLDIRDLVSTGGERGLLGLALPPDTATSRRFYINYTDRNGNTVVARVKRSANPLVADRSTHFALFWSTGDRVIQQPFSNHNGGCLAFGPDGYLYIGMGDGGGGNDPNGNGQNRGTLLGKMLRIDVSVPDSNNAGFTVPSSNPFVANAAYLPEIWDVGVRNPWRFSFDSVGPGATNALIIGDVGQGALEEIDWEPAGSGGRNYGWVIREGTSPTPGISGVTPAFLPLTDPVHQYTHAVGQSVTGGVMSRGPSMNTYHGRYFFADFISGHVYSAAVSVGAGGATFSDVVDHTATFDPALRPANVSAFGTNASGDVFVVDYGRGRILRLSAGPAAPTNLRVIR